MRPLAAIKLGSVLHNIVVRAITIEFQLGVFTTVEQLTDAQSRAYA
jgi:hypothetical protein